MSQIPPDKQQQLERIIEKMKGKPFTMKTGGGRRYRVTVRGIKNNHVVMRAQPMVKGKKARQVGGFSFLLPLLFFLLFLGGDFDDFDDFDFFD
ncbi:MAG: hypothetical protein H0Z33_12520 [Bacillaceae bacterium]|nr:hypothetical protein [Bacillaceae bacterium]